ncbi:hypothetical protein FMN50_06980 [Rhodobacterales bacterium]|nr:hypothetical protein FMN50_06980 [Rhodobacterales bacterium]
MSKSVSQKYPSELRARLMEQETSVRTDIAYPGGGRIVTLGFPGLAFDIAGTSVIEPERMQATLQDPALQACGLLVVLVERAEVPENAWSLLGEAASEQAIRVVHLPIRDYQAPDAEFEAGWQSLRTEIGELLASGGALALSCHYGAGRSGTMAASLLMDSGMTADEAVATVRRHFSESIESEEQLTWLKGRQPNNGSLG